MAEDTSAPGDARPRPASPAGRPPSSGSDTGWAVTGTLISGMAVWGGAGWLLDRWLDILVFFPVGVVIGMALAVYLVVARFGGGAQEVDRISSTSYSKSPGGRRSRPRVQGQTQKGQR